jgi:hypothetical protein
VIEVQFAAGLSLGPDLFPFVRQASSRHLLVEQLSHRMAPLFVLTPASLAWSPVFGTYAVYLAGNVSVLRAKTKSVTSFLCLFCAA